MSVPGLGDAAALFDIATRVTAQVNDQSEHANTIPVFLSFSKPVFKEQADFIANLSKGLRAFKLHPQTLGVNYFDINTPLVAIKDVISKSAGLISVAFRRTHIIAAERFDTFDGKPTKEELRDVYLTTPWPHIEVGAAFQNDLPILVLREAGVLPDGILERGSTALYLPTFDLQAGSQSYLESDEWQQIFQVWSTQVRATFEKRKLPFSRPRNPSPWSTLSPPTPNLEPRSQSTPAVSQEFDHPVGAMEASAMNDADRARAVGTYGRRSQYPSNPSNTGAHTSLDQRPYPIPSSTYTPSTIGPPESGLAGIYSPVDARSIQDEHSSAFPEVWRSTFGGPHHNRAQKDQNRQQEHSEVIGHFPTLSKPESIARKSSLEKSAMVEPNSRSGLVPVRRDDGQIYLTRRRQESRGGVSLGDAEEDRKMEERKIREREFNKKMMEEREFKERKIKEMEERKIQERKIEELHRRHGF